MGIHFVNGYSYSLPCSFLCNIGNICDSQLLSLSLSASVSVVAMAVSIAVSVVVVSASVSVSFILCMLISMICRPDHEEKTLTCE